MASSYFEFKQFKVYHDRCAMKVGTDGVLLGAWVNIRDQFRNVLDIGTGSGLIALMLAQRNTNIDIDAIDIDQGAINQSLFNISNSPYKDRIKCLLKDLNSFAKDCDKKYDLIVSNPPFFINSLKSPNDKRSIARHTDSLQIEDLIEKASSLLTEDGCFSLIFPFEQKEQLLNIGDKYKLHPQRITNVYPTPTSQPKRVLIEYSKKNIYREENNLTIEIERHKYSEEFCALAKDFYIKL